MNINPLFLPIIDQRLTSILTYKFKRKLTKEEEIFLYQQMRTAYIAGLIDSASPLGEFLKIDK